MDFTKLNRTASNYLITQDAAAFNELYEEATALFRKMNRVRITRSGYGNDNDADTLLDSVIFRLVRRNKVASNFGSLLLISIKNAQLDFFKVEKRRRQRFRLTIDSDAPTLEVVDEETVESQFYRSKKEADQLQLIDSLVNDPSQVDYETQLIVSQFSQYDSITALSKALGMHHEFVKRKLRRLSQRYDADRFGDYRDYLAV
ncbi:hypothetical protein D3C78_1303870 [compost metagenome]